MKVGFIGAGKVGTTLGKYFSTRGIEVTGYFSRSIQSAKEAASFTGSRASGNADALMELSDVLFLTVPDGEIQKVYSRLDKEKMKGKILCHSSGSLSAGETFPGIEEQGAYGYSVHPLSAVSDRFTAYREMQDIFFTIEGSEARLDEMRKWLKSIGLHAAVIDGSKKTLYHAAAVIASNHVVALFAEAQEMLASCGLDEGTAKDALASLFLGNARHIAEVGPTAALTGPIERGDSGTAAKHLAAVESEDDRELYRLISMRLLKIAKAKHPERDYSPIEKIIKRGIPT